MENQKDSNSLDYSSNNNNPSHSEVPTEPKEHLHYAVHQAMDSPPDCKENLKECKVLLNNEQVPPLSHSRGNKRKERVQKGRHQKKSCLQSTHKKQVSDNNEDGSVANTKATESKRKKNKAHIQIDVGEQQNCRKIFFALATSSLSADYDILQIRATDEKEDFSIYITTTQRIHPKASAVTGLTFERNSLMYKGQPVPTLPRKIALECFLRWIKERSPVILFACNATFDYTRFFHAITEEKLVEDFRKHIVGFVNTLPVFKEKFPGLPKYKLSVIVENVLKKEFNAHNALADVHALKELWCKADLDVITKGCITFSSAYEKFEKQKCKREAEKNGSKCKKNKEHTQEIDVNEQKNCRKIFFDLETSSFSADCDILQIGATDEKGDFSIYITPTQRIHPRASAVTGLTFERNSLMYKGQPVPTLPRKITLERFLRWIQERSPVILCAHNATFDYTRFFHAITEEKLVEDFRKHIVGFVNTLPVFKEKFPRLPKYKLSVIVENVLKKEFNAHNALADVHALKELWCKADLDVITKGCITFSSAYEKFEKQKSKREAEKNGSKFRKLLR